MNFPTTVNLILARYRNWIALSAGASAYILTLYRFLSYAERIRLADSAFLWLMAISLAIGMLVTIGATKGRYVAAGRVLLGIVLAHTCIMIIDVAQDSNRHNLGPIEFIVIVPLGMPAYIGAAIIHLIDYISKKAPQNS